MNLLTIQNKDKEVFIEKKETYITTRCCLNEKK